MRWLLKARKQFMTSMAFTTAVFGHTMAIFIVAFFSLVIVFLAYCGVAVVQQATAVSSLSPELQSSVFAMATPDYSSLQRKVQELEKYRRIEQRYGKLLRVLNEADLAVINEIVFNILRKHPTLNSQVVSKSVLACSVAARAHNISLEKAIALAYVESTLRHGSKSDASCKGLTQLSSLIWKVYGDRYGMSRFSVYNPFANAMVGIGYYKALLDSHKGNVERALAFYNGGGNYGKRSLVYARKILDNVMALRLERNVAN